MPGQPLPWGTGTQDDTGSSPQPLLTAFLLGLIGSIPTVVLPITLPARWDAPARVFAPELIHTTGHLGWRGQSDTGTGQGSALIRQVLLSAGLMNSLELGEISLPSKQFSREKSGEGGSQQDRSRQSH